jgi:hypothetical protein
MIMPLSGPQAAAARDDVDVSRFQRHAVDRADLDRDGADQVVFDVTIAGCLTGK